MSCFCCVPCFATVDQSTRGVVQKMGRFDRIADPGFVCICFPFQTINLVSTQVRQHNARSLTKTRDNVTTNVTTAIQFAVNPEKVQDYYFKLSNPEQQLEAYVDNIVRGHIPTMDLDTVYSAKEELAKSIQKELSLNMAPYGVEIHACLMTDVAPDPNVMRAMNDINAAQRNREANVQKVEADKLTAVKRAEAKAAAELLAADASAKAAIRRAEGNSTASVTAAQGNAQAAVQQALAQSEVRRLTGVAIAQLRDAASIQGPEVVHYMIARRYIQALRTFAESGQSSIAVPSGPAAISSIEAQVFYSPSFDTERPSLHMATETAAVGVLPLSSGIIPGSGISALLRDSDAHSSTWPRPLSGPLSMQRPGSVYSPPT